MSDQRDTALPLAVEGLTFRYRDRPAPPLRDVSLTLGRGELAKGSPEPEIGKDASYSIRTTIRPSCHNSSRL